MGFDDVRGGSQKSDGREDGGADLGVQAHRFGLPGKLVPPPLQHRRRHPHLADIVQVAGVSDLLHLGMGQLQAFGQSGGELRHLLGMAGLSPFHLCFQQRAQGAQALGIHLPQAPLQPIGVVKQPAGDEHRRPQEQRPLPTRMPHQSQRL